MKKITKLIITVISIIAVISIAVYFSINEYKDNDLKNISTNLLQIQAKTKNIKEKTIVEKNENLYIGQSITDELIEKFSLNTENEIRLLTKEDLNMLGLQNIKEDKKYIVDYDDGEVYYIDGYKNSEGEIFYKLSDINKILIDNE